MRVLKAVLGPIAAVCLTCAPAGAQDAVKTAPNVYRTVAESPRARVLEINVKPGDKVSLHSHPDHLFYALSEGTLVLKPQGRTPYEMTLKAGQALFLPAQTRAVENDGDKAVRALIVEFKTAPSSTGARKSSTKSRGKSRGPKRSRRR